MLKNITKVKVTNNFVFILLNVILDKIADNGKNIFQVQAKIVVNE